MKKFDMGSIASDIRKEFKDKPKMAKLVGVGTNLSELNDSDYLVLKPWWKQATGVPGLAYGRITQIAGNSDTGKTSLVIESMKAAQQQGVGVIYVETEGKTTKADLTTWGVDPDGIILIQTPVAEEAFQLLFEAWDRFKEKYPDSKLLVCFDSIGNTVSLRDADLDMTEQDSKPGEKGKVNRMGISKMIARRTDEVAILVVNYIYANIGSHGDTAAGGKALHLYSSLILFTKRIGWIESQIKGTKRRVGAEVKWSLIKNHLLKNDDSLKDFTLRITKDGISLAD
jgi:RecA/RadA recombinase